MLVSTLAKSPICASDAARYEYMPFKITIDRD